MHLHRLAAVTISLLSSAILPVPALAAKTPARAPVFSYTLLDETPADAFDVEAAVHPGATGEGRICLSYKSPQDCDYLRITRRSLALVRVRAGKARDLAPPCAPDAALFAGAAPAKPGGTAPLIIQRRPETLSVIYRGRLVFSVGDFAREGKVGYGATGAVKLDPPRVQAVEAPAFSDDFMRKPGEAGAWETAAGQWDLATAADVLKSANGFSYRGTGSPAIASAGFAFWSNYTFEASFRGMREGTGALCIDYQNPGNFLALAWGSAEGLRLLRVKGGAVGVLARKPIAWEPGQWYRLSLQSVDGDLFALVDGNLVLKAHDPSFGRGKIALYAAGRDLYFDDVSVKPATYRCQAPPSAHPERWVETGGPKVLGSPAWRDYTYRVKSAPDGSNGIRLVFGWRSPNDYFAFRWDSRRKQIVHVAGRESVIAEAAGGCSPGHVCDVCITFRPGYAAVSTDGGPALETDDPALVAGAVGLGRLSPAVREVEVSFYQEPPPPEEEITKEFANSAVHPDMAEWANPARAWVARQLSQVTGYWRKGEHFGDTWAGFDLPLMNREARLAVGLAADNKDPLAGYGFLLSRPQAGKATVALERAGAAVKSATVDAPGDKPVPVELARQGACVTAAIAGKRVLEFKDPAPLEGSRVALRPAGVDLDLKDIHVTSRNILDYTFHEAPTDWQAQSGVWEITNRWSCQPGWSWFGGRSEEKAVIWNKHPFPGDVVLEYYAAPKMDAVPEPYPQRFRDLNATICGDGQDVNKGYTIMIGGWHNQKNAILKNGRIVAEDTSYHLPPQGEGHHMWFYVRVEKHGNRLDLSVDNRPLLTYEDPDPLKGDRVALWTENNGMMLSRVAVSCRNERPALLIARALAAPTNVASLPLPPGVPAAELAPAGEASVPPRDVALAERFVGMKSRTEWPTQDGKWSVVREGQFAPTEKVEYAYALAGNPEWRDCVLSADLHNGQDAGLLIRAQDWANCVMLVIRPAHHDLWWFVRRNGEWGPLMAPTALEFEPKPLVHVTVEALGDTFLCKVDGKEVSQIRDNTFAKGRVGLYVYPGLPGQAWGNVQVRAR